MKRALKDKLSDDRGRLEGFVEFTAGRINENIQTLNKLNSSGISQWVNRDKINVLTNGVYESLGTLNNFKLALEHIDENLNILSETKLPEIMPPVEDPPPQQVTPPPTEPPPQQTTPPPVEEPPPVEPPVEEPPPAIDPPTTEPPIEGLPSDSPLLQGSVSVDDTIEMPSYENISKFLTPYTTENVSKLVGKALKNVVLDNWNNSYGATTVNRNYNRDEYLERLKNIRPSENSMWNRKNFKNASVIEQVLYADSLHRMAKPDNSYTTDDADQLERNIRLLALLKEEREKRGISRDIAEKLNLGHIQRYYANENAKVNLSGLDRLKPYFRGSVSENIGGGGGGAREEKNVYRLHVAKDKWRKGAKGRAVEGQSIERILPSGKLIAKEVVIRLTGHTLVTHLSNISVKDGGKIFDAYSNEKLNKLLEKYQYIENLKLVSHGMSEKGEKIVTGMDFDSKMIGYRPGQGNIKNQIKQSVPENLDRMLSEKRIRNVFLVGCNTGGNIEGSKLAGTLTNPEKLNLEGKMNEYNIAKQFSKAYPGVYIWGSARPVNRFTQKVEYIVYFTDPKNNKTSHTLGQHLK